MRFPRSLALPLALCAVLATDVALAQALPGPRPSSMPVEHPGADSLDTWAVRLRPGSDPDAVAARADARNLGQIAKLADTYLFHLPGGAAQRALTDARLRGIDSIVWQQQQIPHQRFPRAITDPLFSNQWHLVRGGLASVDANVQPAWDLGADGTGVVIAVADTGVAHAHPDLSPNYRADLSWDFNGNDSDPNDTHGHGTSAAGVAAAADDGVSCGVGAAYNAQIAGLRLIMAAVTDATEAEALAWHTDQIAISSNSWGPSDSGNVVEGPGPLTRAAMAQAAEDGRGGLGTIWVWAAGNGGTGDDVGADGYASMRQTIAVAGVTSEGGRPGYGEHGSAILVAAPTNGGTRGITTTALSNGCTSNFGGTSSAAPLAAGVVALMLDARPQLSWRDVQHVLVQTAVKVSPGHASWFDNAAGLHFNEFFGFGMVDAGAAVTLAGTWDLVAPAQAFVSPVQAVNVAIPSASPGAGVVRSIDVATDIASTEHVEVVFSATHAYRGDIEITLVSPQGTQIRLLRARGNDSSAAGFNAWKFSANAFWGEDPNGSWDLRVRDTYAAEDDGTWQDWQLIVHGTGVPGPQPDGVFDGDGSYADVVVGESSVATTFTLTSAGAVALVVDAAPTLDDATHFAIDASTCAPATDLGTDGNCTVGVRFTPQAAGPHATTLRIATNAGEFSLALTGTGTAASGQFDGATAYPDIRLGHSSDSQTFTLTSNGSAALIVADDAALDDDSHFIITSNTCTEDNNLLDAGECSVDVVLTPSAIGPVSTTLRVATNAGEYALVLTGEGIDPQGALNGGAVFGDGTIGNNGATHTFTLASSGTTALLLESTALVDNSDHFGIVSNGCTGGTDLGTMGSCAIDVRFMPDAIGPQSTTLRVVTNAGELALELTGTGIDPRAALSGDVAFGESAVEGIGTTRTFTLASSGTTALLLESAALDSNAHFAIVTNGCPGGTDLGTTGACTIDVRFLPSAAGVQTTTLRVVSNAGEHTLELTGTGIDPQATLTGSPSFDDTQVGSTSAARVFSLTSSGTTPLVVDSIAALDDATHFSIVANTCVASADLGLGGTCAVTIAFAPVARGALATTLRIATNAGEFNADLTGNATVPVELFADGFETPDLD